MPTYQSQTRIGYTTNYSNGQFTPSAYQNFNTSTYSGTYNPYSNWNTNNGGGGRSGQPRRIPVYNGNDTLQTPGGDNDSYDWHYRYDGTYWWCNKGDGKWLQWRGIFWDWTDWAQDWRSDVTGGKYKDAQDYNPVPIGEPTTPLLLLMFAYLSYHEIKKRRHCKHFFCTFFYNIFG